MTLNIKEAPVFQGLKSERAKALSYSKSILTILLIASCSPDRVVSAGVLMQYLGGVMQSGQNCTLSYKDLGIVVGRGETRSFHPLDTPSECKFTIGVNLLEQVKP